MRRLLSLTIFVFSIYVSPGVASKLDAEHYLISLEFAQVLHVTATYKSNGSWCFKTNVRHNDQGWEHYADGWQVIDLAGDLLGERILGHPHDNEQPFTRSQCNIKIPQAITKVVVRAKCNKHGFGGKQIMLDLSKAKGADYLVNRHK